MSNVEFLTTARKFDGPEAIVQNETMKINCPISEALNASIISMSTTDNRAHARFKLQDIPLIALGETDEVHAQPTVGATSRKNKMISILIVMIVVVLSGTGVWAYMKKIKGV